MPSLTDGAIRQALKRVERSGKQETLTDGEGRGTGRLVLILKPMPTRVTAEWMAQQWRDSKRTKAKIGAYPAMPLAQAREVFRRDYAEVIQRGSSIKVAGDKSEHDYRTTSPRRFKLVTNPAAGIPTEPKVVGTRWLDEDEFARLYRWLECPDTPVHPPYTRAVRILMLTGQRVEEIAQLHRDQWDAQERILDWSKTKNGQPHAIPVPALAAELIDSIKPNEHGWFFPSVKDPSKPVSASTLYSFMWRQRDRGVIPVVTNRDLRRTWKTLAGKAGVPKEIRDRLQNHTLQDVSSKSYDRWSYMPQKRAGMAKWDKFVRALLARRATKGAA